MSAGLDDQYDFALFGTSLPLSILSAALAKAGYSVLHVDDAEHYGGPWASITLLEFFTMARKCKKQSEHPQRGIVDMEITFPSFANRTESDTVPEELAHLNRHFAISLAPVLLPCAGPTIDVMIRSKVASYCTFRLLQETAIFSPSSSRKGYLHKVPSSKEDIFKSKSLSLVDKRRLMKLLQQAATENAEATPSIQNQNFFEYLTSEDGLSFSEELARDIGFGVALSRSYKDAAAPAMQRIKRHISSMGRYGNSAYLVGQYGGAGEMAQCFCRASAVQGTTFVLAHKVSRLEKQATDSHNWQVSLEGIDGVAQVGTVIGDDDMLSRTRGSKDPSRSSRKEVMAILLLDRGMNLEEESPDDVPASMSSAKKETSETALVIFPPQHDNASSVWALQMGEGTFSCPKGTYLVYLNMALPDEDQSCPSAEEARQLLAQARQKVLELASKSKREWEGGSASDTQEGDIKPLMESYFVRHLSSTHVSEGNQEDAMLATDNLVRVESSLGNVATSLDDATVQAEDLYWALTSREGKNERQKAEAMRRRLRRAGYAVGQGLGGVVEEDTAENVPDKAFCDFFPVDEGTGDDD